MTDGVTNVKIASALSTDASTIELSAAMGVQLNTNLKWVKHTVTMPANSLCECITNGQTCYVNGHVAIATTGWIPFATLPIDIKLSKLVSSKYWRFSGHRDATDIGISGTVNVDTNVIQIWVPQAGTYYFNVAIPMEN